MLAVGTASGMVLLHQYTAATTALPSDPKAAAATLESFQSASDPVTALAFSTALAPGSPLWLLVGHSSGQVTVWDLLRHPARQVATIAQHGLPVVHVSFFPGR